MNFGDALLALKSGHPMKRTSWADSEGYLMLMPGMDYVWKVLGKPTPNAGNFIFCVDDFYAEDWVGYTVPVEAECEDLDATPE